MQIPGQTKERPSKYIKLLYLYAVILNGSYSFRISNFSNNSPSTLTHFSDYRNEKTEVCSTFLPKCQECTPKDKYLITSPLFYLNGDPHLGHAYTLVASDVLKRYLALSGHDVKLLVGTDEHGSKIKSSSTMMGYSPKEYVTNMRKKFSEVYEEYDITPDVIVHTSEEEHKRRVREQFESFLRSDFVYRGLHRGYFSPKEDIYYTKSKLVDGMSPLGFEVLLVDEPAYFFNIKKWKERLEDFLDKNPDLISPNYRLNEIRKILETDLNDIAITRSNCDWGVEVGERETVYVWFDALLGYLSDSRDLWSEDRKIIQVLGKDILSFHSILWPAMLMAQGLRLPSKFLVHGWLTVKGDKISKSLGNSIPALPVQISSDVSRFALMNLGDFRYDFEFDPSIFENSLRILRNKFGNTCYRITSLFPPDKPDVQPPRSNSELDSHMFIRFNKYTRDLKDSMKSFRVDKYIQILIDMSNDINKFLGEERLWLMQPGSQEFLRGAWISCSLLLHMALYLMPITPKLSTLIISRLRPRLGGEFPSDLSFDMLKDIHLYSYSPIHLSPLI